MTRLWSHTSNDSRSCHKNEPQLNENRQLKNVIERETDPDTSGADMARDVQREQVKSAELTSALKMREQLEQSRDVDFEGLVDRLNGRDKSRRTNLFDHVSKL